MFLPVRLLVAIALAAEVIATVVVAGRLGVLLTFAWWFVTFVLGVLVIRHTGARAWAGLRGTSRKGVAPGDTALLFLAGLLLAVPGILSDVVGLVLLLPLGRGVVKRSVARRVEGRISTVRGTVVRLQGQDDPVVQAGEVIEDQPDPDSPDGPDGPDGPAGPQPLR